MSVLSAFLTIIAAVFPAYVLGGTNGAIITSKLLYRKDIRDYGSGNPGLTNFYRVFGKAGALIVVAIDVLKTLGPVFFGGWLFGHFYDMVYFGRVMSGLFVMIGHSFPIFYRFRGGKSVMAAGTVLIIIDWRIALIAWGMFVLITLLTRYVSLGAMLGVMSFPIGQFFFNFDRYVADARFLLNLDGYLEMTFAVAYAALLIGRHHENIKRLISGQESKIKFRR